jgi:3-oxoacyl-[acyl-carrier protein] reductase
MKRVTNRKILVTGGSGGIGLEIARCLAEEGADVAIQFNKNTTEADKIVKEIGNLGQKSAAIKAQIDKIGEVTVMRDQIHEKFGKIDTLINCAGINRDSLFTKMTEDQWEEVIQVNLSGVYHCTKAFVEEIVDSGKGRIVNISSLVGQMGNVGQVNYAASKSGIIGFTKALARELAPRGTTVNVIAPGFIDTPMVQGIPEKVRAKILSQIPMGRFGTAREVGLSVVYLVSEEANYITGSVLNLNGGMYI